MGSEASIHALNETSISHHLSPPCSVHHSALLLTRAGRNVVTLWYSVQLNRKTSHLLLQSALALTQLFVHSTVKVLGIIEISECEMPVGFISADVQFVILQIHADHHSVRQ